MHSCVCKKGLAARLRRRLSARLGEAGQRDAEEQISSGLEDDRVNGIKSQKGNIKIRQVRYSLDLADFLHGSGEIMP